MPLCRWLSTRNSPRQPFMTPPIWNWPSTGLPRQRSLCGDHREVAHSPIPAKDANASYDHSECELDAQSISYILCRRYGIERPMPDMSNLAALYEGWEPQECRQALITFRIPASSLGAPSKRIWRWANSAAVPRYIVPPGKVPTTGGVSPLGEYEPPAHPWSKAARIAGATMRGVSQCAHWLKP